jgi:hypothetical protein
MSEQSSTTAAAAPAATPVPAVSPTFGQAVDAEIVLLRGRVAALESAGKADWAKLKAWAKSNWGHLVLTWPAAGTILVPVVKKLLSL